MGFLPLITDILDSAGKAIAKLRSDNTRAPMRIKLGSGLTATSTPNGGTDEIELSAFGAVADVAGAGAISVTGTGTKTVAISAASASAAGSMSAINFGKVDHAPLDAKANYGAVGDGVANDTTALQDWANAVRTLGRDARLPPGIYRYTGTLEFYNLTAITIECDGATLLWDGSFDATYAAPVPAVHVHGCQQCAFYNLKILTNGVGKKLAEGLRLTSHSGDVQVNRGNCFYNCIIKGTSDEIEVCVRIGGDLDSNNDFHKFFGCTFDNYANAGVEVNDDQAYGNQFVGCTIAGGGLKTTTGSINVGVSTTTFNHGGTVFGKKDVGKTIEIAGAGAAGATLRTKLTVWINATSFTIGTAASTTVSGATVTYGAQCAIRSGQLIPDARAPGAQLGGTYIFDGGFVGNNLFADFTTSAFNGQPVVIQNSGSESSRRFLHSGGGGTNVWTIASCRLACDAVLAIDPYVIYAEGNGGHARCVVRDSMIGDVNVANNSKLYMGEIPGFSLINCEITSSNSQDIYFDTLWPSHIQNCTFWHVGSDPVQLENHAIHRFATSTMTEFPFYAYPAVWDDITGDVDYTNSSTKAGAFTVYKSGYDRAMTLILRQWAAAGSPYQIAGWPADWQWEDGPPVLPLGPLIDAPLVSNAGAKSSATCTITLRSADDSIDYYFDASKRRVLASHRTSSTFAYLTLVDNTGTSNPEQTGLVFPVPKSSTTVYEVEVTAAKGADHAVWNLSSVTYYRDGTTGIIALGSTVAGVTTNNAVAAALTAGEIGSIAPNVYTTAASTWRVDVSIDGSAHNLPIAVREMPDGVTVTIKARGRVAT